MQQPTPEPTERELSPHEGPSGNRHVNVAEDSITYPEPPKNVDSAPFYVLSTLFDRLQNERKPDKRRRLLDTWFNVCINLLLFVTTPEICSTSIGVERKAMISIQCSGSCYHRRIVNVLYMG